jgi:hypothetical protein
MSGVSAINLQSPFTASMEESERTLSYHILLSFSSLSMIGLVEIRLLSIKIHLRRYVVSLLVLFSGGTHSYI